MGSSWKILGPALIVVVLAGVFVAKQNKDSSPNVAPSPISVAALNSAAPAASGTPVAVSTLVPTVTPATTLPDPAQVKPTANIDAAADALLSAGQDSGSTIEATPVTTPLPDSATTNTAGLLDAQN